MASLRAQTKTSNTTTNLRRGIVTRQQTLAKQVSDPKETNAKRKAKSPLKDVKDVKQIDLGLKRSAFGDITNAVSKNEIGKKVNNKVEPVKKVTTKMKYFKTVEKTSLSSFENVPPVQTRTTHQATLRKQTTAVTAKVTIKSKTAETKKLTSASTNNSDSASVKSEDSLYVSALEELSESIKKQAEISKKPPASPEFIVPVEPEFDYKVPLGVHDFDKENWDDIYQVSHYAMDIFEYLKSRESHFQIRDYMHKQQHLNVQMRALLIDWMVEVQESFELNHETLYLAVKLVDIYLSKIQVSKDILQLVGAASLFIASKYDERIPPLIDDFIYICDGAYKKPQLIKMEMRVLQCCNFEMGMPLSYRFLRRYARCSKLAMCTLTLARYILEYTLMDYETVTHSDSKLAAAALYIALRMEKISGWTDTLVHYSGYVLEDFIPEVKLLNSYLHQEPKESLNTIRNKYSHKIFHEVAKKPLIDL